MQKASRANTKATAQKQKKAVTKAAKRSLSTKVTKAKKSPLTRSKRNVHVAVIGAAGGIGQPLAMLVKQNQSNIFTKLSLYDVNPLVNGVAADLQHIPTSVQARGFTDLDQALQGAEIVVVPAGVPRKPGMTRDDLFNVNAKINFTIASAVAKNCPNARSLIISNPVNSMVPLWAEVLKAKGVYDPAKLFGVTTLDIFRATTFAYQKAAVAAGDKAEDTIDGFKTAIPVIGGHAGTTIVPLFSQQKQHMKLSAPDYEAIVKRTMFGGDEVVQAKAGGGSATLSMAAAGARFAEQVAIAMRFTPPSAVDYSAKLNRYNTADATEKSKMKKLDINAHLEYAFVQNPLAKKQFGTDFFASGIVLGPSGVTAVHPTWECGDSAEEKLVADMVGDLKGQIEKGQQWALNELATQPKA